VTRITGHRISGERGASHIKEVPLKRLFALTFVLVLGLSLVGMAQGKVAVVLDVGGRGDLSFNDMGFKGTDQAAIDFGLEMTEVQSTSAADYVPNLRNLSRTGEYDLIIGVGFLFTDAMAEVAAEFPEQKYCIIDSVVMADNVMSIIFRENEMSALIGALGAIAAYEHGLLRYATSKLRAIEGLRIIGEADQKAGLVSFVLDAVHPHDIGTMLDAEGVAVRPGHHCAQPVMERYGVPATARASFAMYNTFDEIDVLAEAIQKTIAMFG